MTHRRILSSLAAAALSAAAAVPALADWPMHRANPQRTGCDDGKPGPKSPQVLWVYESQEHFVAAPVAGEQKLFVSALGAFTTSVVRAMALDEKREIWATKAAYLSRPVVCAPAVVEGRMVFGDGMHQTDGATLHCLVADTGRPIWQFAVPGKLVHLEGAPAVAGGRVFIGGGAAGVLCVDSVHLTLNGKDTTLADAQALIDKQWKEMQAKYEAEKKKDPDFAIPPDENALPKPSPKKLWQAGAGKWHVDAPVSVAGDRVLAASAFLDTEKEGDRSLICLDVADGSIKWQTPLKLNPWGGPTVVGNAAIVGCSSIRFEPKDAPGKGEVVAINLANGQALWTTPMAGGVVSPVAAEGELAICTDAAGLLRGLSIKDGKEKWSYDAKAPFFAGAAVTGGIAYAGDLKGVIHAVDIATGQKVWTLDLAADPIKAPGMVYGSPIVHNGKLYVGTCNLDAGPNQQKTVIVCIGDK